MRTAPRRAPQRHRPASGHVARRRSLAESAHPSDVSLELREVGAAGRRRTPHPSDHAAAGGGRLQHAARRDAGRQDHAAAADGRAGAADDWRTLVRRPRRHRRAGAAPPRLDGLPAVHQLLQPLGVRQHRVAAARHRARRRPRSRRASGRIAELLRSGRRCSTAGRPSSPAASSSAPPSRAHWSRTPIWCCSTSRWPTSTTSCASRCATSCRACSPTAAAPWSTRPPSRCRGAAARRPRGNAAPGPGDAVRRRGIEVYREPADLTSARVFSDPPINVATASKVTAAEIVLDDGVHWPAPPALRALPDGDLTVALRPHHVRPAGTPAWRCQGRVLICEISGSESVVHFAARRLHLGLAGAWRAHACRGRERAVARCWRSVALDVDGAAGCTSTPPAAGGLAA